MLGGIAFMKHPETFLRTVHEKMMILRQMELKILDTYAQGRVPGHIHSAIGEEATFVGVLSTKKDGDYWKPIHRMTSLAYMMGMDEDMFWGELMGKKTGNSGGRGGMLHIGDFDTGYLGMSATLGNDAGVCVGAAMTIDYENRNNVVYMFMGDGTSSRGPVYEALTMAKVWNLPVLFICENNAFALSTPTASAIPFENALAGRASGWEMPTKVVDGTDVLAVYEATKELTDQMRQNGGPAILECKNYRWRGHFEGDQCKYRDADVTKEWMENHDPLKMFEEELLQDKVLAEEEIEEFKKRFDMQMDEAILRAEEAPGMTPEEIYDGLYA
jgi:pyruvate dehydrogenase E1 component alpha subunit